MVSTPQEPGEFLYCTLDRKLTYRGARRLRAGKRGLSVCFDFFNCGIQRLVVPRRYQKTVDSVLDELRVAADRGCNNGRSERHSLDERVGEALVGRVEHKYIGGFNPAERLCARQSFCHKKIPTLFSGDRALYAVKVFPRDPAARRYHQKSFRTRFTLSVVEGQFVMRSEFDTAVNYRARYSSLDTARDKPSVDYFLHIVARGHNNVRAAYDKTLNCAQYADPQTV